MICNACEHENREKNLYCTQCGVSLESEGEQKFRLVLLGQEQETVFFLNEDTTSIGRAPWNTVTLDDPQISKKHAVIVVDNDQLWLEDRGSKNGLFLDGKRVHQRATLRDGSLVKLGSSLLKLEALAAEQGEAA